MIYDCPCMNLLYLVTIVTGLKYCQFCDLRLLMTHFNEKKETGGDISKFKTVVEVNLIEAGTDSFQC